MLLIPLWASAGISASTALHQYAAKYGAAVATRVVIARKCQSTIRPPSRRGVQSYMRAVPLLPERCRIQSAIRVTTASLPGPNKISWYPPSMV